ncbi:hypothetical protein MD484_g1239, partial [Candolleomyces efflorescens]
MTGFEHLIGKPAPAFTLPNFDGTSFEYKPGASGLPTALLFYPQSGSYGCTQQICSFRDAVIGEGESMIEARVETNSKNPGAEKTTFKPETAQVIAISPDPVEKQKQFVEKEQLPFPVLSDTEKEVPKLYGIGKGFFGFAAIARVTFIVDKEGIVRDALDTTVNYNAHQKFVDKWFQKLEAESAS